MIQINHNKLFKISLALNIIFIIIIIAFQYDMTKIRSKIEVFCTKEFDKEFATGSLDESELELLNKKSIKCLNALGEKAW